MIKHFMLKIAMSVAAFIWFSGSLLFAQSTPPAMNAGLTDVAIPSPSAGALSKFGSIPVGPSTGIPSVSIPIYAYQGFDPGLSMSISLNYHAGGIRTDEIASNVGLGWALSAGGVITRTMRGIPDETPLIGFINSTTLPQNAFEGNSPGSSVYDRPFNKIHTLRLDGQNDIFSFSFNGRSGKFIFGKNGDFLMLSQQKLVVTKQTGTVNGKTVITQFTIIDEQGTKYTFSDYELTSNPPEYNLTDFTSSWYLSKIVGHSGLEVNFSYESISIPRYNVSRSATEVRPLSTGPGNPVYTNFGASISSQILTAKRLKSIMFPNGLSANFAYATVGRTDWAGDRALSEVAIFNGTEKHVGMTLSQNYSLDNRLTLISATPFGEAQSTNGSYHFEYVGGLPSRFSNKQDHWGFPNDNSGGYIIPQETYNGRTYTGANRETSAGTVKAGSLRKIVYPSKGYTIFDLEANDAITDWSTSNLTVPAQILVGGLRAKRISDYDGTSTEPVSIREFQYTLQDGITSSGKLGIHPVYSNPLYYAFRYDGSAPNYTETYQPSGDNVLLRSTSSIYDLAYVNGSPVTYERVVQFTKDGNGQTNGKTIMNFTAFSGSLMTSGFPYVPPTAREWMYGLLKDEFTYDKNNVLLKHVHNDYEHIDEHYYQNVTRLENFRSVTVAPVKFITADLAHPSPGGSPVYFLENSFLPVAGRSQLIKTTIYDKNSSSGQIERSVAYQYDPNNYYKVKETIVTSVGDTLVKSFLRPSDMVNASRDQSGVYQMMLNKNIINPIVEDSIHNNQHLISFERKNFGEVHPGMYMPVSVQKKNLTSGIDEVRQVIHSYSLHGRPISVSNDGGPPTSFVWGFNDHIPAAKLRYQDTAEVSIPISGLKSPIYYGKLESPVGHDYFVDNTAPEGQEVLDLIGSIGVMFTSGLSLQPARTYVCTYWENQAPLELYNSNMNILSSDILKTSGSWRFHRVVFNGVSGDIDVFPLDYGFLQNLLIYPLEAEVERYTGRPLVGTTSTFDQRNQTTYYEYDEFQRLKTVKDQDGNVLKSYTYHYKN